MLCLRNNLISCRVKVEEVKESFLHPELQMNLLAGHWCMLTLLLSEVLARECCLLIGLCDFESLRLFFFPANTCNKRYFFGLLTLLNGCRVAGVGRAIWVTVAKHVNRLSSRGWGEETARRWRPPPTSFSAFLAAVRPFQPAPVHS